VIVHGDKVPFHNAAIVQDWLTTHSPGLLPLPDSSDLVPADFFFFRLTKDELVGVSLDQNTLKKECKRVTTVAPCPMRIEIGGSYVEKS
jgi:hypothetical protein